jgi:coenzyme F420-reducing hydrogenase delta subunit
LRSKVPQDRLQIVFASSNDGSTLAKAIQEFRIRIETEMVSTNQLQPYFRRTTHHA